MSTPIGQLVLCRILAVWCLAKPQNRYKQGMHELLGQAFLALYKDLEGANACPIKKLFVLEPNITPASRGVDRQAALCDPRYIEHDSFAIFDAILESADGPR